MRFSTIAVGIFALLPFVSADFHYGIVNWTITTATGQYKMVLPASQTTCEQAYDFYPKAAFGFDNVTYIQVDICGKEIVLDSITGAWYTHGRTIESGTCTPVTAASESCSIGNLSGASYTDLLYCTSDICS